jgi:hypothetical protein
MVLWKLLLIIVLSIFTPHNPQLKPALPTYHQQSPADLTGTWACIAWAESRDTNTGGGDGGGYFQFESETWAYLTPAPWPPTQYSFGYQYQQAQKLQSSVWGWSPWHGDGCV